MARASSVGYSTAVMALFVSDQPLSARQRYVNWGAMLVLSLGGIAWGLELAKQCASITSGYAAQYDYAIIVFVAIGLFILAVPPLIYWRTNGGKLSPWCGGMAGAISTEFVKLSTC